MNNVTLTAKEMTCRAETLNLKPVLLLMPRLATLVFAYLDRYRYRQLLALTSRQESVVLPIISQPTNSLNASER